MTATALASLDEGACAVIKVYVALTNLDYDFVFIKAALDEFLGVL